MIVLISIYFDYDPVIKGCLLAILIACYCLYVHIIKPYKTKSLNQLAVAGSFCMKLTVIFITILYQFETGDIEDHLDY